MKERRRRRYHLEDMKEQESQTKIYFYQKKLDEIRS